MKKIVPMPEYQPPPKKTIDELLSQKSIEETEDLNRRSFANAQFRNWPANEDNPTRPDLKKDKGE